MIVKLLEVSTNRLVDAIISNVTQDDLKAVAWNGQQTGDFPCFDWFDAGRVNKHEIFKLEKDGVILGLIKFFSEDRILKTIELNKLEVSLKTRGSKNKTYDYVAGCLIAFACLKSRERDNGDVYVLSKRATRSIYLDKYSMKEYNEYYLLSDVENNNRLISRYLSLSS